MRTIKANVPTRENGACTVWRAPTSPTDTLTTQTAAREPTPSITTVNTGLLVTEAINVDSTSVLIAVYRAAPTSTAPTPGGDRSRCTWKAAAVTTSRPAPTERMATLKSLLIRARSRRI